jgi:hypothetical protein
MGSRVRPLTKLAFQINETFLLFAGSFPTGDLVCRASFASRDKNQKLHDAVIDLGTTRLYHKDILFSNASQDLDAGLALCSRQLEVTSQRTKLLQEYICELRELDRSCSHA